MEEHSHSQDGEMRRKEQAERQENTGIVSFLANKMVNGEVLQPRFLIPGSVMVNGSMIQSKSSGALARLTNGIDKIRNFETVGGPAEEDVCSTSGQDDGRNSWRAVERCIAASIKGFVIGAGLRGGLSLFAIITRLRKKSSVRKKGLTVGRTNNEAIMTALRETLRYGLFLGTFAGGFCTVEETIAALGGCRRTAAWRSLVAGAVAGPSLLLTGHKVRHTSMAIYILLRATVLAGRCGLKSERAGWLCKPLSWRHGDTFLMCLSSCQILSAWILKPDSLPKSYISFLNKHGGKHVSIIRGINQLAFSTKPFDALKGIEEHYKSTGVDIQLDPDMSVPCTMIHGMQGCVPHFFSFLGHAYLRSLPVYIPVYLVPALLVHRKGLFARPFPILLKSLLGIGRSSFFLSVYCASAWAWTCFLFRSTGICKPPLIATATVRILCFCTFMRAEEDFPGYPFCSLQFGPWMSLYCVLLEDRENPVHHGGTGFYIFFFLESTCLDFGPLFESTSQLVARRQLVLSSMSELNEQHIVAGLGLHLYAVALISVFPVGLAVMIEKKSRRMELALYCFARAIESFAICVTDWGLLERYNLIPPKRIDVFLFSAATAIIMHCYAQERDVFRSKYLNVLDWVFGLPNGAKPYTPLPSARATPSENKVLPPEQASGPITDDSQTGIATNSGIVLASRV